MLSVSLIPYTIEVMSLHDTLETLTLRGSNDIDKFPFLKHINCQHLTILLFMPILKTSKLGHITLGSRVSLCKVPLHRLRCMRLFLLPKRQLYSIVSVRFDGFHLCNYTRTSLYNSARHLLAVGIKQASHTNFFT